MALQQSAGATGAETPVHTPVETVDPSAEKPCKSPLREALEMAALAAGIPNHGWRECYHDKSPSLLRVPVTINGNGEWRPQSDDAHSRQLQVLLRMTVSICDDSNTPTVLAIIPDPEQKAPGGRVEARVYIGQDIDHAVRTAVLRAALLRGRAIRDGLPAGDPGGYEPVFPWERFMALEKSAEKLAQGLKRALELIGSDWEDGQGRPLKSWHQRASSALRTHVRKFSAKR